MEAPINDLIHILIEKKNSIKKKSKNKKVFKIGGRKYIITNN